MSPDCTKTGFRVLQTIGVGTASEAAEHYINVTFVGVLTILGWCAAICIPRGRHGESDVSELRTFEETPTTEVINAFKKMHGSSPISAQRTGEAVGIGYHQTH